MNISPPHDFSRLSRPAEDLRAHYEKSVADFVRVLWRRRILIVLVVALVLAASLAGARLMGRTYVSEALVQLKMGTDATGGTGGTGASSVVVDAASMVEGEAEIIRSRVIAKRVLDRLQDATVAPEAPRPFAFLSIPALRQFIGPKDAPQRSDPGSETAQRILTLQKGLTVKTDGKTYFLHIVYAAKDPTRAATVANAFATEYLAFRSENSAAAARRTSDWLSLQVAQAAADRKQAGEAVSQFRKRTDVIALDAGNTQMNDQQIRDVVAQMSAAELDRLRLEGRLQRLDGAVQAGRVPSAVDLQGSTDAQRLIDAEVTARQESARVAGLVGIKHPLYARAEAAHAEAQRQLNDALSKAIGITQADFASARASLDSLAERLATLKAAASEGPMIGRTLKELEADELTAQGNLDRLRETYRQARAVADLTPITGEIVSGAEPDLASAAPKMSLVAALGAMAGVALSGVIVALLHLRDNGYETDIQLARDLKAACAGMIPSPAKRKNVAGQRVRAQALKSLAIRTGLAEPHQGCIVAVVTSTLPGEGKGTLVRSLASTLGQFERRVLIVENRAGSGPDGGAGHSHEGSSDPGEGVVSRWIIGTASTPYARSVADLSGLFSRRERLESWIAEAGQYFDVIIVEAPAIMTEAGSLVITRIADIVLFATRWRSTPRAAVAAAFKRITLGPGQEIMTVITEVDLRAHRKIGVRDGLHFSDRYAGKSPAGSTTSPPMEA